MQPDNWSDTRNRIVSSALVTLLLASTLAVPAAADPAMVFDGAEVEQESALVGENITVRAEVDNIGSSGGGYELTFARNGTELSSPFISVDAGEDKVYNESVQFEEPGTYEITVNGERAGIVEVRQAVATVEEAGDDERTLSLRGQSVPTDEEHAMALPSASNRSFALDMWSVRADESAYEGTLTEYTEPREADVALPPSANATLLGVVTVDANESIEGGTVQFTVGDEKLSESDLSSDEVTIFQRNDSRWEPLETEMVAEENESTVYEASSTSGSAYAVGRIEGDVSVVESAIQTESVDAGQRIVFEATVENDGSVEQAYEGELTVDGEAVNATELTVPAASERTVTLSYVAVESGSYTLALGDSARKTVVITEQQASGDSGEAGQSGSDGDGSMVRGPIPDSLFGINTLFVGVGAVLVIVVATLLLRSGGNNGGGGFEEL